MSAEGLHRSMLTHRDRFLQWFGSRLRRGTKTLATVRIVAYTTEDSSEPDTYDLSQDYFRFMFADGVEPTNNHSEQQIRHC